MPVDRQISQAPGNSTGGVHQANGAQACTLGRTGTARGKGDLGGARRQIDRRGQALQQEQSVPLADNGESAVQPHNALGLVGEDAVGTGLLEGVCELRLAEEIGQRQMHRAGTQGRQVGDHPGRTIARQHGENARAGDTRGEMIDCRQQLGGSPGLPRAVQDNGVRRTSAQRGKQALAARVRRQGPATHDRRRLRSRAMRMRPATTTGCVS